MRPNLNYIIMLTSWSIMNTRVLALVISVVVILICSLYYNERFFGSLISELELNQTEARLDNLLSTAQAETVNIDLFAPISQPHWEYNDKISRPYNFSHHVCENSYLNPKDCTQTSQHCNDDLMNWVYLDETNTPLPKFSVDGFRCAMRNKRLVFIGSSLMRALSWTLGHTHINWSKIHTKELEEQIEIPCTAPRSCFIDVQDNITICFQFMGTMTTNIYLEENYTLNLSLRGHGDSSCLLHDDMIANLGEFDMVFFQPPIVWWSGTRNALSSDSSPKEWLQKIIPIVYYDALNDFPTKISKRTKPILVLGQIGTACQNKTQPEAWSAKDIPNLLPHCGMKHCY